MPYASNADLLASVRSHLPGHAQDIFRAAFNHAFESHHSDPRQEEIRPSNRLVGSEAALQKGGKQLGAAQRARRLKITVAGASVTSFPCPV